MNLNFFSKEFWDQWANPINPLEEEGAKVIPMASSLSTLGDEDYSEDVIQNAGAIDDTPKGTALPAGRVSRSISDQGLNLPGVIAEMNETYGVVTMDFIRQMIPIIRGLTAMNPDMSQALHNVISLSNTGHKVHFDKNVSPEDQERMRNHLENKRKDWSSGQAGMDGVVNKMFAQLCISGAVSNEWIPNNTLTGIETIAFVDPENIIFKLNKAKSKYEAYQRPKAGIFTKNSELMTGLVKLNPNTYKYYALNGDTELPYGIPPYMSAIPRISSQTRMLTNVDFIIDTVGLIGFLETLIDKPDQNPGENNDTYVARLNSLLHQAKIKVLSGMKDGVVVGYKDDHEFQFHSAARNYDGVSSLFQENELQIASGVKQDAALLGRGYATSETQITVVFTKLLSELRNMQNIVKTDLEYGYSLELRLAGFKFEYLRVQFNRSTLQDDYKYQQAEEIKIRNVIAKYLLGVIDHDTAADELGYETPAEKEPLVAPEMLAGKGGSAAGEDAEAQKKENKGKKASDKKTRKNNKPVPKENK